MHENDKSQYRSTVTLPRSESYLADDFLNYLSAEKYPCMYGKQTCNQCPHFEIMSQNFYTPPLSDCIHDFKSRHANMNYFSMRLYKAAVNNKIELWNAELDQVKDPSTQLQSITDQLIRWWMKTVYILPAELIQFCQNEGVLILYKENVQQKTLQAAGQSTNTSQGSTLQSESMPSVVAQTPTGIIQQAEAEIDSKDKLTSNPPPHTKQVGKTADDAIKRKPKASSNVIHPLFENFDDLPDSAFVPVEVVAALFGCSIPTIWRRVKQGTLKTHHHGLRSTRWLVGELRLAIKETNHKPN